MHKNKQETDSAGKGFSHWQEANHRVVSIHVHLCMHYKCIQSQYYVDICEDIISKRK